MEILNKTLVLFLAFLTLNFYVGIDATILFAKENKTKQPVEIQTTPEVEMTNKEEQKKRNWWSIVLIGSLLFIAGAASSASGDGGGGDGSGDPSSNTGSLVGSW